MQTDVAIPAVCKRPISIDPTSLSPDGRLLVSRTGDELEVTDLERDQSQAAAVPGLHRVVCLDGTVLALARGEGWTVRRFDPLAGTLAPPVELPVGGDEIEIAVQRTDAPHLIVTGEGRVRVEVSDGELAVTKLQAESDAWVPISTGCRIERIGDSLMLCRDNAMLGLESPRDLLAGTRITSGAALARGQAAVELRGAGAHRLLVYDLGSRRLRNRFHLNGIDHVGFVERRGHAVLVRTSGAMSIVDLKSGRCVRQIDSSGPIAALACDASGQRLVVAMPDGEVVVSRYPVHSVVLSRAKPSQRPRDLPAAAAESEGSTPDTAPPAPAAAPEPALPRPAESVPASKPTSCDDEPVLPTAPLLALWPARAHRPLGDADREQYLRTMARLMMARARRISATSEPGAEDAAELEALRTEIDARWTGPETPHVALAADLGLSPLAVEILWVVAAPQVFGELARVYCSLAADAARPLCDELLVATLLDAGVLARAAIARELEPDAPLVRSGAVSVGAGVAPFAPLSVDLAVVRRLRGDCDAGQPQGVAVIDAPDLDRIHAPRRELAALMTALTRPRSQPTRVVLRGPVGSGRRTLAAALAARCGRQLGAVRVEDDPTRADVLRTRLADIRLRGWLPCVDVTTLDDDPGLLATIRELLDEHDGPLFVRAGTEGTPPIRPGYLCLDLPIPSITSRRELWLGAARRAELTIDAERLAGRFGVGPGVIARAVEQVASFGVEGDTTSAIAAAVRQHRDDRIDRIATRIERLPSWDQLVLPADLLDSVHELVGRIRHRRRALEEWGFASIASTARGTTALFQGAPGTGKTLVAGVIARELDFELYRVDLSRVMSRWVGETEKNLAAVFDAAEGGDVILLFDEADSLFAKRTEVKSSNDRYANIAVNYLLQRLDSFSGVAILTTNFGTSIDDAFRRRMSFRLTFPLPEVAERERLWRAHIPPACPTAGDLGLAELARRYEMSGGYIRNAALRAAFLAARDDQPLSAAHLERAVHAEYRDAGQLHHGRLH